MLANLTLNGWLALVLIGLLAAIGLVVVAWLAIGLFQARSLIRRELSAYFLSPIAYVVLVVFLAVTGFLYWLTLGQLTADKATGVEYPLQYMLGMQLGVHWLFWLVFLVIPPVLTMRLFAEERGTGTLEVLMTSPLRDWQVVLSKYLACCVFYGFMWLPTVVYLPMLVDMQPPVFQAAVTPLSCTLIVGAAGFLIGGLMLLLPFGTVGRVTSVLLVLGGGLAAGIGGWAHYRFDPTHIIEIASRIDPAPVASTYLGLALAGGMLLSMGLLVSSLVRSQLVAFLVSLAFSLMFIVLLPVIANLDSGSTLYQVLFFFCVPLHFSRDFTRGLVDTRHLVLYVSVTVFCLFLTVRSLESRRWS